VFPGLTRGPFWLASFAVHGAVFLAAGHSRQATVTNAAVTYEDLTVVVTPEPELEPVTAAPLAPEPRTGSVHPPTHTHPYPVPEDHDAHPHDPSLVHLSPFLAPALPTARPTPAIESEPVAVPAPPARFVLVVDSRDARGLPSTPANAGGDSPSAGVAAVEAPGTDGAPIAEEAVSSPASLLGRDDPPYPPEARAREIEGDVLLELVVSARGTVTQATVVRRAGYGFDESALQAARSMRFSPAQLRGVPVAVRKRWPVSFRLR
jgi:protein TonB